MYLIETEHDASQTKLAAPEGVPSLRQPSADHREPYTPVQVEVAECLLPLFQFDREGLRQFGLQLGLQPSTLNTLRLEITNHFSGDYSELYGSSIRLNPHILLGLIEQPNGAHGHLPLREQIVAILESTECWPHQDAQKKVAANYLQDRRHLTQFLESWLNALVIDQLLELQQNHGSSPKQTMISKGLEIASSGKTQTLLFLTLVASFLGSQESSTRQFEYIPIFCTILFVFSLCAKAHLTYSHVVQLPSAKAIELWKAHRKSAKPFITFCYPTKHP